MAVLKNKNKYSKLDIKVIVILIVFISFFYFYGIWNLKDPQADPRKEIEGLKKEISTLMLLPKDEEPTVATVSDLTKLAGQEFFANASIGDKVLMYVKTGKAILYSPKEHLIINVAPISTTSKMELIPQKSR
ncbi:MAG: hypothetical protein UT05_C0008G0037 [Parcubacteria group bacterium GW2011_GWF2_38_76]|nr:MAG: hypothetical protein UT05_C0008G0037 [Parcubacteria group bacterium GW2011_GWF2_38_76]HBM45706.1 hypothetical protein [Patescibacteria group bacterium]